MASKEEYADAVVDPKVMVYVGSLVSAVSDTSVIRCKHLDK